MGRAIISVGLSLVLLSGSLSLGSQRGLRAFALVTAGIAFA